jgi:hypothetical protein
MEAMLVVVDPLMAFLDGGVDAHRDQGVRRAMAPLKMMAEKTNAAIVVVRHLTKDPTKPPMYRGGGSIGIVGAARSSMLMARDPDDDTARIIATYASNLAASVPALRLRVIAPDGVQRVEWLGESRLTAEELLSSSISREERSAIDEAEEFVRAELAGSALEVPELEKRAKQAGVAWATVRRAKKRIGAKSRKSSMDGAWLWHLPISTEGDGHE